MKINLKLKVSIRITHFEFSRIKYIRHTIISIAVTQPLFLFLFIEYFACKYRKFIDWLYKIYVKYFTYVFLPIKRINVTKNHSFIKSKVIKKIAYLSEICIFFKPKELDE